jgi:hypothetical protein
VITYSCDRCEVPTEAPLAIAASRPALFAYSQPVAHKTWHLCGDCQEAFLAWLKALSPPIKLKQL